ncbi:MAG: SusC/RagA family TonB-linked outer membrane protein [Tannerella sp.]|jgi:TonB-linked SusC/RagA family outer membrane protein|nr:SusC/RagA family TonB-linked outer membrane protein [Tannerella sp.]
MKKNTIQIILLLLAGISAHAQGVQLQGKVTSAKGKGLVGVTVAVESSGAQTTTDPDGKFNIGVNAGDKLSFTYFGFKRKTIPVSAQEAVSVTLQEGFDEALQQVTGTVTDEASGHSVAGARISVINTRLTAMSDTDGTFVIQAPSADVVFSVEAPGYQSQTVALQGRTGIEIRLLQQTGTDAFSDTPFSTVNAVAVADFSPDILTIDEDLTARLSGQVRAITHSGAPGSGAAVFVRGFHSLTATSQPLYVVDGVPWQAHEGNGSIIAGCYNNPLAVIDPDDVDKITVLKGASALYGSKGANGVILIDTKRSRTQATEIALNISAGYRTPFQSIPVMDAEAYRRYASDVIANRFENTSYVDKYQFLDDDPAKSYYPANHNNTDWLDLVNVAARSQHYGVSVKGGDNVALYAVSVGYTQSEGNVDDTGFDRLNFRANSDISLTPKLQVAFNIAFTQASNNLRNDGIDSISSPVYLAMIKSPLYSPYEFDLNGKATQRLSDYDELNTGNPLSVIRSGIGKSRRYALSANARPSYTFGEDRATIGILVSYGWKKLNESAFVPDRGLAEYPLYNAVNEIYAWARNRVADRMDTHSSIFIDGRADWNVVRNETNLWTVAGGYRYYSDAYKSRNAYGYNSGSDNMTQLSNTTESLRFSGGISDNTQSISWYADAGYAFKNRYLLNVSAAMDASSRFGKNIEDALNLGGVSWGIFPSVSAGWIVSSERFMQAIPFVNFLKLTAAHTVSGNDDLPNYATRTWFSAVSSFSNATGLVPGNIGNPRLKWETTRMSSAGLDFSLCNNRWKVNAQVYTSTVNDLLTLKQLSEQAGLQSYWSNGGELRNTGYEVTTSLRLLNGRNLKLDFGASIGHYRNEITALADGSFHTTVAGAQVLTQVGQPTGVFYGYKTRGVFSTREEAASARLAILNTAGQPVPFEAGDMHFEDVSLRTVDGYAIIDESDRQIIGNPNPDFYGNFNFNLSWKRFTLDALFTYTYGNDVYNAFRAALESGKNTDNQSTAMQDRWVANGQITDIPRAVYGDPLGNARFSDRWMEDGSFLKFKSLSLTYRLPLHLTFLQEISVWGAVSNVFTWTGYLGSDPEFAYGNSVLYQGIDAGLLPSSRSYSLGIKINL